MFRIKRKGSLKLILVSLCLIYFCARLHPINGQDEPEFETNSEEDYENENELEPVEVSEREPESLAESLPEPVPVLRDQLKQENNLDLNACENRIFTNDMVPVMKSELKCQGDIFRRSPSFLAAYDCCAQRKENIHCRMVCLFRSTKLLREDGTWDRPLWIKTLMADFGPKRGPIFAANILECLSTHGPYKPTEKCFGIESLLTCMEDVYVRECREASDFLVNTVSLGEGNFECDGKIYHVPRLLLDYTQECFAETNSTYMRHKCYFTKTKELSENNVVDMEKMFFYTTVVYGMAKTEQIFETMGRLGMGSVDLGKSFGATTEENSVSAVAEGIAIYKETVFEACGSIFNNDILSTI